MSFDCGAITDTTIFDALRSLLKRETRKQGIKIWLTQTNAFHISCFTKKTQQTQPKPPTSVEHLCEKLCHYCQYTNVQGYQDST